MKAILLISTVSSFAFALVMPSAFPQERPVLKAKLSLVPESESPVEYRLELNRPATQKLATSFTFYEGMTGIRCGGRCSLDVQRFQVVTVNRTACGATIYRAAREGQVAFTDDEPDTEVHPTITVIDHTRSSCGDIGWEVEHIQDAEIRHFSGVPESLLTIL